VLHKAFVDGERDVCPTFTAELMRICEVPAKSLLPSHPVIAQTS
jgi:hypothetical protein